MQLNSNSLQMDQFVLMKDVRVLGNWAWNWCKILEPYPHYCCIRMLHNIGNAYGSQWRKYLTINIVFTQTLYVFSSHSMLFMALNILEAMEFNWTAIQPSVYPHRCHNCYCRSGVQWWLFLVALNLIHWFLFGRWKE